MKFKVYHVKNHKFGKKEAPEFKRENYDKVAELELHDVDETFTGAERAFNWTQNSVRVWYSNSGVIWHKDGHCRSSAVGDVMVNDVGLGYRCEVEDWTELGKVDAF